MSGSRIDKLLSVRDRNPVKGSAGLTIEWTGPEYAELQRLAALYTTRALAGLKDWGKLTPEKQVNAFVKVINAAVHRAEERLIQQQGGTQYLKDRLNGGKKKTNSLPGGLIRNN